MHVNPIYSIRRKRLLRAAQKQFEQKRMQVALADAIGRSPNYVSRLLSDPEKNGHKRIGEKLARHIEQCIGKPRYWLDGNQEKLTWPFRTIDQSRVDALSDDELNVLEDRLDLELSLIERRRGASQPRPLDQNGTPGAA